MFPCRCRGTPGVLFPPPVPISTLSSSPFSFDTAYLTCILWGLCVIHFTKSLGPSRSFGQMWTIGGQCMFLDQVVKIVDARLISKDADLGREVVAGCGADLMSDVLAFTHPGTLLLTGLTNPQVIRTAEMVGISAIVFVRGKVPPPETVALANDMDIILLATRHTLYETCGRLYQAGLPGCGVFDLGSEAWQETFGSEL